MFKNINIFQIITVVAGLIIGIVAILIFSGKMPGFSNDSTATTTQPTLIAWGTLSAEVVRAAIDQIGAQTGSPLNINYTYIAPSTLATTLSQAVNNGASPDVIFATSEQLLSISSLLYTIPYTTMSQLAYQSMFIDGAYQFGGASGARFYPILADPLITIFNKTILTQNGLSEPPSNWAELSKYQMSITKLNSNGNPQVSAFGMGANNVTNNKGILIAMLMQTGCNIVQPTSSGYYVDFFTCNGSDKLRSILQFQTSFSDPQKTTFTWSELSTNDRDTFTSGNMGIYFGKASDLQYIRTRNPNLQTSIRMLPQWSTTESNINITTGDLYGVAVARNSSKLTYAVSMAVRFTEPDFVATLANFLGMSTARKDILAGSSGNEFSVVVGNSTRLMRLFYDAKANASSGLVSTMFNDVLTGRRSVAEAANNFINSFQDLYQ